MILEEKVTRHQNVGLLFLRLGVGSIFIIYGLLNHQIGPDTWPEMGYLLVPYGINISPEICGWTGALLELVGGSLLVLGIFPRLGCFLLLTVSAITLGIHLHNEEAFSLYAGTLQSIVLFVGLMYIGPGKYTLSELLLWKRGR